jgi:hypothetical protein
MFVDAPNEIMIYNDGIEACREPWDQNNYFVVRFDEDIIYLSLFRFKYRQRCNIFIIISFGASTKM